jgi:peptide/nickel transport system permease protein
MTAYLVRRVVRAVASMFVVSVLVFVIYFVLPSTDPAVLQAGRNPSIETIEQIRHDLGLDLPLWTQYGRFISRLVLGDRYGWPGLGYSYQNYVPVREELLRRFPVTAAVTVGATLLWLLIGIPIGIVSAVRRRSVLDRSAMIFVLLGVSMPPFWLGLLFLYILWFRLGLACPSGYVPLARGIAAWSCSLILPWITLALLYAAWYTRMVRSTLIETLSEDFIRTARAKGVSEHRVVLLHALRAAVAPVVTMLGLDIALLFAGTVVIETVFNLPGIGRYAFEAVQTADLPAIMGTTLITAGFIVIANLVVDIVYALIDPRVRLGAKTS